MITIHQKPFSFTPSKPFVGFVVSSTNATKPNFHYIADIFVEDVFVQRLKRVKNNDGYGYFDISAIVSDWVESEKTEIAKQNPFFVLDSAKIHVKFGEVFGIPPVEYPQTKVSDYFVVWDAWLDNYQSTLYDSAFFLGPNANFLKENGAAFLEYKTIPKYSYDCVGFLDIYESGIKVDAFSDFFVTKIKQTIFKSYKSYFGYNGRVLSFFSGFNLNNSSPSFIQLGDQNVLPENTKTYELIHLDGKMRFRYKVLDDSDYSTIWVRNQFGILEATYWKIDKITKEQKIESFKNLPFTYKPNSFKNDFFESDKIVLSKTLTKKFKAFSVFFDYQDESDYYFSLLGSGELYLQQGDKLIPIELSDNAIELKKKSFDVLRYEANFNFIK